MNFFIIIPVLTYEVNHVIIGKLINAGQGFHFLKKALVKETPVLSSGQGLPRFLSETVEKELSKRGSTITCFQRVLWGNRVDKIPKKSSQVDA